jgi:hypothetical protein
MDKNMFEQMLGESKISKEQYVELITDVLNWTIEITFSLAILDDVVNKFDDIFENLGKDVVKGGMEDVNKLIKASIQQLVHGIISKHANLAFEGGINIEDYVKHNMKNHVPDVYKPFFHDED